MTRQLRVTDNGGKTRDDDPRRDGERAAASAPIRTRCSTQPASSTTGVSVRPQAQPRSSEARAAVPALQRAPPSAFRGGRRRSQHAARFNGATSSGQVALDLSQTSQLTVEFWLKWNAYANDDSLAMEFTPNFNASAEASWSIPAHRSKAASSASRSATDLRGTTCSSTGRAPEHGTTTPSCSTPPPRRRREITPYVDGAAATYTKADSGSGGIILYFSGL